jgi:predicted ABC-type ATPase
VTSTLDARPIIVAIAGPNGAGKSTFFAAHLADTGLRFINADDIAKDIGVGAYEASSIADAVRRQLVRERESFIFETVFSDPPGEKVAFLEEAASQGYAILLCFIGLDSAATSDDRVAMRVMRGGHDVPPEKLPGRYARSLENLGRAMRALADVRVYDNSDLARPYALVARVEAGRVVFAASPVPSWLTGTLASVDRSG